MELPAIKLAVFEFDDTLAVHKDSDYLKSCKGIAEEYYRQAFLYPYGFYDCIDLCLAPDYMLNLVEYLKRQRVKLYCVSELECTLNSQAKQWYLNKYYKDIELIGSDSQEHKIAVTRVLQLIHKCKPEEVLLVDSNHSTLELLKDAGYIAIHRSEVEELTRNGYRFSLESRNLK